MSIEKGNIVECHSGHSYPQRPTAFTYQDERREVEKVLIGWRSPEGIHFRVLTTEGEDFELSYFLESDSWQVQPF